MPVRIPRVHLSGVMALIPAYPAETLSNPSIAFPLRLQQGLLEKTDEREAYMTLLGIMARTPRGSWAGHPSFGFREFFSEIVKEGLSPDSRTRVAEAVAGEINSILVDLGLTRYRVDSLLFEPLEKDTEGAARVRRPKHMREGHGVTLMLRESGSDRATGYTL
jgi:hypothetical protein